jgi:hypothetical protein
MRPTLRVHDCGRADGTVLPESDSFSIVDLSTERGDVGLCHLDTYILIWDFCVFKFMNIS